MKYANLVITDLISGKVEVIHDYATMPKNVKYAYLEWKLSGYEEDKIPIKLDYSYGYSD